MTYINLLDQLNVEFVLRSCYYTTTIYIKCVKEMHLIADGLVLATKILNTQILISKI